MSIFYGDNTLWTINFAADNVTIQKTEQYCTPLKNYYVSNPNMNTAPYFTLSSSSEGSAETVDNSGPELLLYKGVTYQFIREEFTGHGFGIRGVGGTEVDPNLPTEVVLLNKQEMAQTDDKLLVYVPTTLDGDTGTAEIDKVTLEYYCTNPDHADMKGKLVFQNQTVELPKDYKSLVNTDRHMEGGQNIRLEIDGEEIVL